MRERNSSDDPLRSWHQHAARHPGFIGYALRLVRERTEVTEEQQRATVGIPADGSYDSAWLHLQAMTFPRAGEAFESDVKRIADYIAQKVQEHHQLTVMPNAQGLLDVLAEARKEVAIKLTSQQPFAVAMHGLGTLDAENVRRHYLVYLPEGTDEVGIELSVAPSGGGEYVTEWANHIRACSNDEEAVRLLTSFSLTMAEAMTNRMLDSMSDLLGVPRMTNE